MNKEALKLAIQLRDTVSGYWTENEIPIIEKLIELLAQPAQEPVAWRYRGNLHEFDPSDWATGPVTPLYTAPPQRPWVGLTDEEIKAVNAQVSQIPPIDYTTTTYAKAIEAKLKEKNT